ncbi:gas vesicle protein GvpG [Lysinibacillus yapensis]|uniref:Gas vesicle protein GvpG n=1 Tax=Ureibacillus yapensis TaxID=2304605 RepID=A0A396S4T6_9BACL|nr:gas vesicle protein GvpG [Lysinibacillus yapensis]RHW33214.1 gas vesicle protein GvpG [Lysinibacillus yapensis]
MIHKLASAPINLVIKIAEKVKEEADREFYDLPTIQQKLIQLQMMYELGDIPEKVFKQQEEELIIRYETAKRLEMEQWEEMAKRRD